MTAITIYFCADTAVHKACFIPCPNHTLKFASCLHLISTSTLYLFYHTHFTYMSDSCLQSPQNDFITNWKLRRLNLIPLIIFVIFVCILPVCLLLEKGVYPKHLQRFLYCLAKTSILVKPLCALIMFHNMRACVKYFLQCNLHNT